MGGGRGTTVHYQAPPPDNSFAKFLEYQQQRDTLADQRVQREADERRAAEEARKAGGRAGYQSFRSNVESQLRQGLLEFSDAQSQLRDFATKYDMAPVETDVAALGDIYTKELLPTRQQIGVTSAYEEILGRPATEEEKKKAQERFQAGYYKSNQELRDALYKSTEYQDKFNQSYIDNYYDTKFGKQTLDEQGKKTGKRTYTFASNLMPTFVDGRGADLETRTGIQMPKFEGAVTGTAAELEEQIQNVRDSRQFLYSAGLTNLQGEIDKETQKLKTQGMKDIQNIQNWGNIATSALSGFWG